MSDPTSIPTTEDPFFTLTASLDGRDFVLEFVYMQRSDLYLLHLSSSDGTRLRSGVRLVPSIDLLGGTRQPEWPQGVLLVLASGPDDSPPRLGELAPGARCSLIYQSVA